MNYPKRLIEVDLPIARISAHARREKSIRHGHISTLHIWWARRPLAACRAVICGALWPDPADENCPQAFRDAAARLINAFACKADGDMKLLATSSEESKKRWADLVKRAKSPLPPGEGQGEGSSSVGLDPLVLRGALLDFIADFANWDNSTVPAYLETSRALTQAAHEALGGEPGTRPLVVDPFAGGGSIPLEALRVGADAFASDLNPVAVLLNKVVLEYIPKYGQRLADEVRKWGKWIKEQAEKELAEFYPKDPDGATSIAYFWARTILSDAPGEGCEPVEIPLVRSLWLAKKATRRIAMRWVRDARGQVRTELVEVTYADGTMRKVRRPLLEIFEPRLDSEVGPGTIARGSATCPVTGFTTPVKNVREQLRSRRGGASDARLFCVATTRDSIQGRFFRLPTEGDLQAAQLAAAEYARRLEQWKTSPSMVPNESFSGTEPRRIPLPQYGIVGFADMFSPRQLLMLSTLVRLVRGLGTACTGANDSEFNESLRTCLALAVDRQADFTSSLSSWWAGGEKIQHTFARQAMPIVWDFVECNPFSDSTGCWDGAYEWGAKLSDHIASIQVNHGQAECASATHHPLPDDVAEYVITDPPYYYSVPYSDLSDFFYVWLKRTVGDIHGDLFATEVTPKDDECVQNLPHSAVASRQKDRRFYERAMQQALTEGRRVAKPDGLSIVVFAHTDTAAWEALVGGLIEAGWCVTASWPIDTEMATRVIAQRQRTLASSIHLVCRPRESPDGTICSHVGEWRDVLTELPKRIHEWMPRLAAEGVVGADALFACLGPALEIFSRYSRVEKSSGEAASLREYLEHVWAVVSTEALSMIFHDADAAGLEPDARLTAMWLWTLGGGKNGTNGSKPTAEDAESAEEEDEDGPHPDPLPEGEGTGAPRSSASSAVKSGYVLEFDAARKIAQGLGIHLEKSESIVEVKGDKARLLPVAERTQYLFGKDAVRGGKVEGGRRKKKQQRTLFEELDEAQAAEAGWTELRGPPPGTTVLDRLHQAMILFAAGRGELMKRFLLDDGIGSDARFWKLAQSLSALYPSGTEEKRWVDGVLARKKGLGL